MPATRNLMNLMKKSEEYCNVINMTKYYTNYVWKNGLPYGIQPCESNSKHSYKIVSDPYHKRNSIEEYLDGQFSKIIYDSALFDFRQLKLGEQIAWQKTLISETASKAICHIRNQDDRLTLIEEYTFEQQRCRECRAFTPQGILLSIQKLKYVHFKDEYNGVILFDANDHPIMLKKYAIDESTEQFSQLLHEQWEKISVI